MTGRSSYQQKDLGDIYFTGLLSAPEAIRLLEQERFDVIISIIRCPAWSASDSLCGKCGHAGEGSRLSCLLIGAGRGGHPEINNGTDYYLQKGGEPGETVCQILAGKAVILHPFNKVRIQYYQNAFNSNNWSCPKR